MARSFGVWAAAMLLLAACGAFASARAANLLDVFVDEGLTDLAALFAEANMTASILTNTTSEFTIFGPDNTAVQRVNTTADDLEQLQFLLNTHIVAGRVAISDGLELKTLNNLTLLVNIDSGVNTVTVLESPIAFAFILRNSTAATNGNVYVIDRVLVVTNVTESPPVNETLLSLLLDEGLTFFVLSLNSTDLVQEILEPGVPAENRTVYTVFAPDNKAFVDLTPAERHYLQNHTDVFRHIIETHIVEGAYRNLTDGQNLTTINNETLHITIVDGNTTVTVISEAGAPYAYVIRNNTSSAAGVVYVIDRLLFTRSNDTLDVALLELNLTTTFEAYVAANLTQSILTNTTANFTIFGPTDAAWLRPSNATEQPLEDTLLRHTVVGRYALEDGLELTNMLGETLLINTSENITTVRLLPATSDVFAFLTGAAANATNGVVYAIDQVLVPVPV